MRALNLAERKKGTTKPRGRYRKAEDAELTPLIRAIVDERPTYGYRRVCALANRKLRAEGKPPVNAKRVLRIMQATAADARTPYGAAARPHA